MRSVLKAIDQIRTQVAVSLRIELWNGRQFYFCSEPSVTVTLSKSSALRYFISPNLNKSGEAFVEGSIRVEGSPKNVFKVAEGLARSMTARLPSAFQWVAHHSRDREAIQYHGMTSSDIESRWIGIGAGEFIDRYVFPDGGCVYGFSNGWMNLFQVLCRKAENSELRQQPLTRDYMYVGPL